MTLICPGCRTFDPLIGISDSTVNCDGICASCGRHYPILDGVLCLPPDIDVLWGSQQWAMAPDFLELTAPHWAAEWRRLPAEERIERSLVSMYAQAHYPRVFDAQSSCSGCIPDLVKNNENTMETLADLIVANMNQPHTNGLLEVGCGPGGLVGRLSGKLKSLRCMGFDLRVAALRIAARLMSGERVLLPRRTEGNRFVTAAVGPVTHVFGDVQWICGDLFHPPFRAESFDVVAAMSLLDTLPDPWFGLGQLDALLSPGGLLLLATPYHWEPRVTPESLWWCNDGLPSDHVLTLALRGRLGDTIDLNYEIILQNELPWYLPAGDRLTHCYGLHVIVARKRA